MMDTSDLLTYDRLDRSAITPMMMQYLEQKDKWPDAILMFRLGDFYEMFFDDAITASRVLDLALTGRDCGLESRAPMCGVPHHAAPAYMQKLVLNGYKVAVCDQLEDPAAAKGIVKRAVTRLLTPGTITDAGALDDKKNNYIVSIFRMGMQYGFAASDLTTGSFEATQLVTGNTFAKLLNQAARFGPSEMICNQAFVDDPNYSTFSSQFPALMSVRPDTDFSSDRLSSYEKDADTKEKKKSQNYWDMETVRDLLCRFAASALLCYLEETQQTRITHLQGIHLYRIEETMELDSSTRKNLEITETLRSKSKMGSLLWAIDRTRTAMGGRLLRRWMEQPLIQKEDILQRQDAVEEAKDAFLIRSELLERINGIHDLERLTSRIALGSVNARDLLSLKNSLEALPEICTLAKRLNRGLFSEIADNMEPLDDLFELLAASIPDEPPISVKEGGIIRTGFSAEVDSLRTAAVDGKSLILSLEQREREKTGIRTMRIGYNRVFGYYLEVSKGSVAQVPETYIRKQTLANGERYITEELKTLEDTILGANQRLIALEYSLFCEIREKACTCIARLQTVSQAISALDVLLSLAEIADREKYVRPQIEEQSILEIRAGRHPVVEKMLSAGAFVPNDLNMDSEERRILILTGPNMAGKSTYMRQTALLVLLAQMGSFVPAESARIGIVDRIFTRIGASDDLSSGQSTFMVEMNEVSTILRNATRRSLLILDEVGRGTSTYDGLSLAWSILEFLSAKDLIFARTLFATHYHELNMLEGRIRGIFNAHVEVEEKDGEVLFLHRIHDGGTDDSYGIEVARLAGVPQDVLLRAKEILSILEKDKKIEAATPGSDEMENTAIPLPGQMTLFSNSTDRAAKIDPIREELARLDISKMTPLEAMNILYAMIERVKEDDGL